LHNRRVEKAWKSCTGYFHFFAGNSGNHTSREEVLENQVPPAVRVHMMLVLVPVWMVCVFFFKVMDFSRFLLSETIQLFSTERKKEEK
jgi:hypothetical protein